MRFAQYEQLPPTGPTDYPNWALPIFKDRKLEGVQGRPLTLTWHYTVGGFQSSLNRLRTQISSHFLVDRDGRTVQIVDTDDAAWTQGVITANERGHWVNELPVNENLWTIGIEIVNAGWSWSGGPKNSKLPESYEPYTEAQKAACVELQSVLCKKYGILRTRRFQNGHEELDTRKQDPGPGFFWYLLVEPEAPPMPEPDPNHERALNAIHWLGQTIQLSPVAYDKNGKVIPGRENTPRAQQFQLEDGTSATIDEIHDRLLSKKRVVR